MVVRKTVFKYVIVLNGTLVSITTRLVKTVVLIKLNRFKYNFNWFNYNRFKCNWFQNITISDGTGFNRSGLYSKTRL